MNEWKMITGAVFFSQRVTTWGKRAVLVREVPIRRRLRYHWWSIINCIRSYKCTHRWCTGSKRLIMAVMRNYSRSTPLPLANSTREICASSSTKHAPKSSDCLEKNVNSSSFWFSLHPSLPCCDFVGWFTSLLDYIDILLVIFDFQKADSFSSFDSNFPFICISAVIYLIYQNSIWIIYLVDWFFLFNYC